MLHKYDSQLSELALGALFASAPMHAIFCNTFEWKANIAKTYYGKRERLIMAIDPHKFPQRYLIAMLIEKWQYCSDYKTINNSPHCTSRHERIPLQRFLLEVR